MHATPPRRLGAADLITLARRADTTAPCEACAALRSPGWESMPSAFDRSRLTHAGSLRDPADEEPTLQEFHPQGTHGWSPEAPIAPGYHPYNRCDVWLCMACARPYLRYTEYGGYYQDERVRQVDPRRVVAADEAPN